MRETQDSKRLFIGIALAVVLLFGGASFALANRSNDQAKQTAKNQAEQQATRSSVAAANTVQYDGVAGKTALALLKEKATVVTKDSSYGPYVDSINGVQGGTDGKYWAFYVNGTMAQVGADAYTTKTGDKIEWKFE